MITSYFVVMFVLMLLVLKGKGKLKKVRGEVFCELCTKLVLALRKVEPSHLPERISALGRADFSTRCGEI